MVRNHHVLYFVSSFCWGKQRPVPSIPLLGRQRLAEDFSIGEVWHQKGQRLGTYLGMYLVDIHVYQRISMGYQWDISAYSRWYGYIYIYVSFFWYHIYIYMYVCIWKIHMDTWFQSLVTVSKRGVPGSRRDKKNKDVPKGVKALNLGSSYITSGNLLQFAIEHGHFLVRGFTQ